jgi:hypothetical protein
MAIARFFANIGPWPLTKSTQVLAGATSLQKPCPTLAAPLVTIADGETGEALASVKAEIAAAFSPFLKTPDKKPRPLIVFVEFGLGSSRKRADRKAMLQKLVEYTKSSGVAAPKVHRLGLNARIGWGPKGRDSVLKAIDLAREAGIRNVSVDGVVRKDADRAISHPGLTNYLAPGLVAEILRYAAKKGMLVRPLEQVAPDTVARSIWSALNTARAMGLRLGKYSLLPLTLDESERVVDQVQRWFSDWSAAPVFYVDQGIIDREDVYVERNRSKGVAVWLRAMAKHGVKVVLIDTVDKSKGWKLLRAGDDPKGLLSCRPSPPCTLSCGSLSRIPFVHGIRPPRWGFRCRQMSAEVRRVSVIPTTAA